MHWLSPDKQAVIDNLTDLINFVDESKAGIVYTNEYIYPDYSVFRKSPLNLAKPF